MTLLGDDASKLKAEETAISLMSNVYEQFPGILITEPSVEGRLRFASGKEILRLKFRIWPNRGQPIETVYVQESISRLQEIDGTFKPWMIAVTYEVEQKQHPLGKTRTPRM